MIDGDDGSRACKFLVFERKRGALSSLLAGSAVGRRRSGRHVPGGAFGWAVQSSFLMQWPMCTCSMLVLGGTHAC
ncbi:hypothetical protein U1Q18_038487 [Sarracenia purpurea var. burkii]